MKNLNFSVRVGVQYWLKSIGVYFETIEKFEDVGINKNMHLKFDFRKRNIELKGILRFLIIIKMLFNKDIKKY